MCMPVCGEVYVHMSGVHVATRRGRQTPGAGVTGPFESPYVSSGRWMRIVHSLNH